MLSQQYQKYFFLVFFFILFSCGKERVILDEKFDNNNNHWDVSTNNLIYSKIENGEWKMSCQAERVLNISLISVPFSSEIRLSARLKTEKFYSPNGLNGLILFADNQKYPKNYLFFGVNGKNELIISLENLNPKFAQTYYMTANKNYKPNQDNIFSIFIQKNENIQFLINGVSVINIKKPVGIGDYCGFVTMNSEITADDFLVKVTNLKYIIHKRKLH